MMIFIELRAEGIEERMRNESLSRAKALGTDPARDRLHDLEPRNRRGGVSGEHLFLRPLAICDLDPDLGGLSVFHRGPDREGRG